MATINTTSDQAGLRKAAVFLASLDPATAERLLGQLGPQEAALVREAAAMLDDVAPAERQRVLDEFRHKRPLLPISDEGGIELDTLPWNGNPVAQSDVASDDVVWSEPLHATTPFDFLAEADDSQLADLLRAERPQTVALVLSHLPPQRAGEVLTYLAATAQVEIVRRLVDIEKTDPATVHEVDRALRARWSQPTTVAKPAGTDVAAKILASCDGQTRGQILNNLASHDQTLAERFGGHAIEFEELGRFDDNFLRAVLRSSAPAVILAALLGAPPKLLDRFLGCLTPLKAHRLRDKLNHPGPIRLSDVEEARRQMAAVAQRLLAGSPDNSSFAA